MASVFSKGKTAVITGAASGIGNAAARKFASFGMNVIMADVNESLLKSTAESFPDDGGKILTFKCDVSDNSHVTLLRDLAFSEFPSVDVFFNNAGISGGSNQGSTFNFLENWRTLFEVNFWGQRNGLEAFVEPMHRQGSEGVIICTGSKQGITNPPGNGAYNATKAAVKSMTEHLAWELRQRESRVTAHLLVPGWTYTGLTATSDGKKPDGAWSAEQVVEYLLQRVDVSYNKKEFYIICPDNAVDTPTDNARMLWNVNDIVERRPALSRWSEQYKDEFEAFVKEKVARKQV